MMGGETTGYLISSASITGTIISSGDEFPAEEAIQWQVVQFVVPLGPRLILEILSHVSLLLVSIVKYHFNRKS